MRSPIPRTILAVSLSAAEGSEAALEILRSGKPRRLSPHEGMTFGTPAGRKLSVASADPIGRPACQGNVPVARRPTKANMTGRIRGIREIGLAILPSGPSCEQGSRGIDPEITPIPDAAGTCAAGGSVISQNRPGTGTNDLRTSA